MDESLKKILESLDEDDLFEIRRSLFKFCAVDITGELLVEIPESINFGHLNFRKDDAGYFYSGQVMEYIAMCNGIRLSDLEGDFIAFIGAWYRDHLNAGGEHDETMDGFIKESRLSQDYPGADDDWFIDLVK